MRAEGGVLEHREHHRRCRLGGCGTGDARPCREGWELGL